MILFWRSFIVLRVKIWKCTHSFGLHPELIISFSIPQLERWLFTAVHFNYTPKLKKKKLRECWRKDESMSESLLVPLSHQTVVRGRLSQVFGEKAAPWSPSGTARWGLVLSSRLLSRLRLTSNLWLCYIRINYRYFPPKWVTLTKTLSAGNLALFAD